MPKIGMEPVRRRALVDAALQVIGDQGTLSVTMSDIARKAGVSPALAHHYFGSKEQLLTETIRFLLRQLRNDTVRTLKAAEHARDRISAIIRVSFQADQFAPQTISAWLAFYSEAQRSEATRRLLVIYARRLHSNLVDSLKQLCSATDANRIAEGTAAMIDGLYIRRALGSSPVTADASMRLTDDYITLNLQMFSIQTDTEKGHAA
ncbi:TetR/AcrR family transcriptional repressor of bet genes [Pararhizobium capsulatum DSM 1112]|uniref:HTH-type transcriptional regulator BetI n=1 Tax=Pararhizobium capsulatum DSM 1112 TaxID=1121113 RepID=A0ABU0BML3_9HYPH|nr:transcriptional regulator BetI [Pararhizobium capsulatum]MDQ0319497.1 TetR/AcrR family transcriptional repressor of bet genes [Pararhizobium capsulatum DSM 1112]